jgi:hypothetical protein
MNDGYASTNATVSDSFRAKAVLSSDLILLSQFRLETHARPTLSGIIDASSALLSATIRFRPSLKRDVIMSNHTNDVTAKDDNLPRYKSSNYQIGYFSHFRYSDDGLGSAALNHTL